LRISSIFVRQQESAPNSIPQLFLLNAAKDINNDNDNDHQEDANADHNDINKIIINNLEKEKDFNEAVLESELMGFQSDMRAQQQQQQQESLSSSSLLESASKSTINTTSTSSHDSSDSNVQLQLQLTKAKAKIKSLLQSTQSALKPIITNIFKGEVGKRGEAYLFLQLFLTYSIAIGHMPLLKNFIQALFGPILLLGGVATMISSIQEMHSSKSFTAFTTPVSSEEGGTLVNGGVYGKVRHPVYAGNVAALIGWSVMSNSAMRLFLTFGYYMVVEKKVKREEEEMKKEFGNVSGKKSYEQYMVDVPDRFIPFKWMNGVFDKVVRKQKQQSKGTGDGTGTGTGGEDGGDGDIVMLVKQKEAVHKKNLDTLFENQDQEDKSKIENEKQDGEEKQKQKEAVPVPVHKKKLDTSTLFGFQESTRKTKIEKGDNTKLNGSSSVKGSDSTRNAKGLFP